MFVVCIFYFIGEREGESAMFRFQPMRRKGEKRETPGSGEESAIIDFNQWEGKEKRERDSSSAQGGNKACFSC